MAPVPGSRQTLDRLNTRRARIVWMSERRRLTAREIARELDFSIRTVQRHLSAHRAGVAPKHPGPQVPNETSVSRRRIVLLRKQDGLTTSQIAREVGLSPRRVRFHLAAFRNNHR